MYIPFKNKKYITKVIQSALSLEIQTLLWNLIESMSIPKKDSFQIFKFTKLKKILLKFNILKNILNIIIQ